MSGTTTGLTINITYDSSVTSQSSDFQTQFKACVAAAVAELEADFTNALTLNITVGYGEVDGLALGSALGESVNAGIATPYSQVTNALIAHATTADQLTADATLNDPALQGISTLHVANAEAKDLGLLPANQTGLDGAIGISSLAPLDLDPNNRGVAYEYDAIGVIEHEITEVMGRVGRLNAGGAGYTPLDLFRYTSAGLRDLTPAFGYFSLNGQTLLAAYNNPTTGGDAADWDPSQRYDAFDQDTYLGYPATISTVDEQEMSAIGWSRASVPGQPANSLAVALAAGTFAYLPFADSTLLPAAAAALNPLSVALLQGSLSAATAAPNATTTTPEAFAQQGGLFTLGPNTSTLVDTAATPVTILGGANAGQLVAAGTAGLAFNAGSGAGTVIAGGGTNLVSVYQGAGDQNIMLDGNNDTVIALAGNDTIAAGPAPTPSSSAPAPTASPPAAPTSSPAAPAPPPSPLAPTTPASSSAPAPRTSSAAPATPPSSAPPAPTPSTPRATPSSGSAPTPTTSPPPAPTPSSPAPAPPPSAPPETVSSTPAAAN